MLSEEKVLRRERETLSDTVVAVRVDVSGEEFAL